MIVREFYKVREDGVNLYRTFSDEGRVIIRDDGVEYDEAIDVEGSPYAYTETDREIEPIPEGTEEP